jgi:hypothetical protein
MIETIREGVEETDYLNHKEAGSTLITEITRGLGGGDIICPLAVLHRVHRVATAAFWCTFHHQGKISPGW